MTWTTVGGRKYEPQAASALSDGSNFIAVSPVLTIPGVGDSSTNYLEIGGATAGTRLYRVRLVP